MDNLLKWAFPNPLFYAGIFYSEAPQFEGKNRKTCKIPEPQTTTLFLLNSSTWPENLEKSDSSLINVVRDLHTSLRLMAIK